MESLKVKSTSLPRPIIDSHVADGSGEIVSKLGTLSVPAKFQSRTPSGE